MSTVLCSSGTPGGTAATAFCSICVGMKTRFVGIVTTRLLCEVGTAQGLSLSNLPKKPFRTQKTISGIVQPSASGAVSRARVCPLSDNSGQRWTLACDGLSAFDPKRTLAVHCGTRFDAGFSPYQSTRLSRYNAVS